jgi:hypothetical protein
MWRRKILFEYPGSLWCVLYKCSVNQSNLTTSFGNNCYFKV